MSPPLQLVQRAAGGWLPATPAGPGETWRTTHELVTGQDLSSLRAVPLLPRW